MSKFSKPLPVGKKRASRKKNNQIIQQQTSVTSPRSKKTLELEQSFTTTTDKNLLFPSNINSFTTTTKNLSYNNLNAESESVTPNDDEIKDSIHSTSQTDDNFQHSYSKSGQKKDSHGSDAFFIPPMDENVLKNQNSYDERLSESSENDNITDEDNNKNNNNSWEPNWKKISEKYKKKLKFEKKRRNSLFDINEELELTTKYKDKRDFLRVPKDSDDESDEDDDDDDDEDNEPPKTLKIRYKFTKENPMPYLDQLTPIQRKQEEMAKNLTAMGFNDYQILDAFQNVGVDVEMSELIEWIASRVDPNNKSNNKNKDGSAFDPHTTPLPKGWERLEHNSQIYYYDQNTNQTQWRHPLDPQSKQMTSSTMTTSQINLLVNKDKELDVNNNKRGSISSIGTYTSKKSFKVYDQNTPVPDGWIKAKTQQGRYYYYQESTQRTQWEHPHDPDGQFMKEKNRKKRKRSLKSAEYNPVNMDKSASYGMASNNSNKRDSLSLKNKDIDNHSNHSPKSQHSIAWDKNLNKIDAVFNNNSFDPDATPLPDGWQRLYNENIPYYHNNTTNETSWRHPLDPQYNHSSQNKKKNKLMKKANKNILSMEIINETKPNPPVINTTASTQSKQQEKRNSLPPKLQFNSENTILPKGWVKRINQDGIPYYEDTINNIQSYFHPLDPKNINSSYNQTYNNTMSTMSIQSYTPPTQSKPIIMKFNPDTPLPKNWKKKTTQSGDVYYKNKKTKEKSWYHPLSPDYEKEKQKKNNNVKTLEQRKLELQSSIDIPYDANAAKAVGASFASPYQKEMYQLESQKNNGFEKKYNNKKKNNIEKEMKKNNNNFNNMFNPDLTPLPDKNWVREYRQDGSTIFHNILTGQKSKYHPLDPNNQFKKLHHGVSSMDDLFSLSGDLSPESPTNGKKEKKKKKKADKRSISVGFFGMGKKKNKPLPNVNRFNDNSQLSPVNDEFDPDNTPLPNDWKRTIGQNGVPYYFNKKNGQSSWRHPLDPKQPQTQKLPSPPLKKQNSGLFDPETTPLPYGWSRAQTDQGLPYYYHNSSKETSWRHPLDPKFKKEHEKRSSSNNNFDPEKAPLPKGWSKAVTENGIPYYYYKKTQQTSWRHPLDPKFKK